MVWNVLFAPKSVHAALARWVGADRALNAAVRVFTCALGVFNTALGVYTAALAANLELMKNAADGSQEGWCPIGRSVGDGGLSRGLVFAALG